MKKLNIPLTVHRKSIFCVGLVLTLASMLLARADGPLSLEIAASPDPVAARGRIDYAITVSNLGSVPVQAVKVEGLAPSGLETFFSYNATPALPNGAYGGGYTMVWNLGDFAPGQSRTILLSVVARFDDVTGTVIALTLRASATGVAEILTTRQVVVDNNRRFNLRVSADQNPVAPGGQIKYTLVFANLDSTSALNTVLKVAIPAGTAFLSGSDGATPTGGILQWALDTVGAGESGQREFVVTVPPGTVEGTIIVAEPDVSDAFSNQARAIALSVVKAVSPLSLAIAASPDPVAARGRIDYAITVNNHGAAPVQAVKVEGLAPIGLETFFSDNATPALPNGAYGGGYTMLWNLGDFAAGQSRTILLSVVARFDDISGTAIALTLRASATGVAEMLATKVIAVDSNPIVQPAGTLKFSSVNYTAGENAGAITITVNRVGGTSGDVSVHYETRGGTATEGTDYIATYGTLKFLGGQTSKSFPVPIINDSVTDPGESFTITLSIPKRGASLGAPSTATVTITELGPQYVVTPSAGANGSINPNTPQPVNSGGNLTFTATPVAGYAVDQWLINGGGVRTGGSSYTVSNVTADTSLHVTFTAVPSRVISLSGSLAFGSTSVGSPVQSVLTIGNSGNVPLTVSGIAYPNGFSGNWPGGAIAAGNSQEVIVTFAPTLVKGYSGTLTINSDATAGTNTIAASGTGTAGPTRIVGLSGNLAFGNIAVNSTVQRTLTIRNTGSATLTVSGISYPSAFSGDWSGMIGAGNSQQVTVTFAPTSATGYSGSVTVNSDATGGSKTIAVSGTGDLILTVQVDPANGGIVSGAGAFPIGVKRSVRATANSGWAFTGWSGDGSGNTNPLTVMIDSDKNIVAHFELIADYKGSYQGLIKPVSFSNELTGKIGITLNANWTLTTTLQLGGKTYSLHGAFDPFGNFAATLPKTAFELKLEIDPQHAADQVTGTLLQDGALVAPVIAKRTPTGFSSKNPMPLAGYYTLALPADPAHPEASYPQGRGYGFLTVAATGSTRFAGVLGDVTVVSLGGVLSNGGDLPVYLALYGAKGSLSGWLALNKVTASNNVVGTLDWFKPAIISAWYPAEFSGQIAVNGSLYVAPPARPQILNVPPSGNFKLTFGGGNVTIDPATKDLTIDSKNKIKIVGTERFTMTLTAATGYFSGTFYDSSKKLRTFKGAVLQQQNTGSGLFQGNGQTGTVELDPAP